jgi:hypothetical protein
VKRHHALLIAALAVASTSRVLTQDVTDVREFDAYVNQTATPPSSLSESEHLLIFSNTVQVPGATLHAGAYIFKFVPPSFMQVLDASRAKVYTMFGVIPVYNRFDDDGRERIRFQHVGNEETPRIVAWHIPGRTGFEFPYRKSKQQSEDRRPDR